jgi:hypothetical protein
VKFQRIDVTERAKWQAGIVALEQTAYYPFGDDYFQIDHGADYFAFFDRLGEVHYYVGSAKQAGFAYEDAPEVAAVGAGILRDIPYQQGAKPQSAWYLCDLKVHPQHQGRLASVGILSYAIAQGIQHCNRGYLISMNPSDGSSNKLVKMLQRFAIVPFRLAGLLNLYSVDAVQMVQLQPLLEAHRGAIGYRSLQGVKDLRLQRRGEVLPLLHVQWGQGLSEPGWETAPRLGFTHMFCAESQDPLVQALAQMGVQPQATASIVADRMQDCDWRFVLTSDI